MKGELIKEIHINESGFGYANYYIKNSDGSKGKLHSHIDGIAPKGWWTKEKFKKIADKYIIKRRTSEGW